MKKLSPVSPDRTLVEAWVEAELRSLRERNDSQLLSNEETFAIRGAIASVKKLRSDLLVEKEQKQVYMSEVPGDY